MENHSLHQSFNATRKMPHIDGIKGILCFMVMFGHFWNIYRNCQEQTEFTSYYLNLVEKSIFNDPALVATFWLYAFLVISGYLLSSARICNIPELLKKTAKRFLRFFLPILGACFFIYILQETIGFHADETTAYFTNKWFQKFYRADLGWTAIFTESLRAMTSASCRFNSPFWVIRDMLVSSILIYVCSYTDYGRSSKNYVLPFVFFLCAIAVDRQVVIACLAGFNLKYYKEYIDKLTKRKFLFLIVAIVIYVIIKLLIRWKFLPMVFDKIFLYIFLWCAVITFINQSSILTKLFSFKLFLLMGKISFGVYAFHWPVICSAGSLVLIKCLEAHMGTMTSFGLSLLASILCTLVLSVIYLFTVEKASDRIIRLI